MSVLNEGTRRTLVSNGRGTGALNLPKIREWYCRLGIINSQIQYVAGSANNPGLFGYTVYICNQVFFEISKVPRFIIWCKDHLDTVNLMEITRVWSKLAPVSAGHDTYSLGRAMGG